LTFIVVYMQSLDVALESTGVIASLALISAIVSAPLFGRFYDRTVRDARMILLVCGIGISAALAAASIPALPAIVASVIAIGFFAGGAFTVAYAKARAMTVRSEPGLQPEKASGDAALNVAWINGLSLVGILWMPLVFSVAVKSWGGYQIAWALSAVLTALLVFIPLQRVPHHG
jgi:MFS family permease